MLLVFVGVIVRFWILQAMGGSGERQRLQRPEVAAVERTWGVKLPRGIETYLQSETVKRREFHLASRGSKQEKEWWYGESFLTLTYHGYRSRMWPEFR